MVATKWKWYPSPLLASELFVEVIREAEHLCLNGRARKYEKPGTLYPMELHVNPGPATSRLRFEKHICVPAVEHRSHFYAFPTFG